jgi:hypothetical protein
VNLELSRNCDGAALIGASPKSDRRVDRAHHEDGEEDMTDGLMPSTLLEQMTTAVPYLRVASRRDADDELEWLRCAQLVNDGEYLLGVVRSTAAGRGTDRDDIALSLFAQAYAFRIASVAIGASLLSGGERLLDVRPANMAIALGRHRPNAVAMNHVKFGSGPLNDALFDEHLAPFVATAHAVANERADNRVGENMLWGNIATGCAAAFGAFGAADNRAIEFFDKSPEPVRIAGQYVESTDGWAWERNSCCFWFQIPSDEPFYCQDCPRRAAA